MPPEWADRTVEAQIEDVTSTLSLYRSALELRALRPEFSGDEIDWYGSPSGCLAFRRRGGLVCALNATDAPIPLPPGELLLASAPLVNGELPPNAAAWLVCGRQRRTVSPISPPRLLNTVPKRASRRSQVLVARTRTISAASMRSRSTAAVIGSELTCG